MSRHPHLRATNCLRSIILPRGNRRHSTQALEWWAECAGGCASRLPASDINCSPRCDSRWLLMSSARVAL